MSEGHSSSYDRLKSQKTLKEILEVATEFEKTARDFYTDLIPKVSKRIRYLVEEMAEEEQRHFDLFTELMNSPIEEELARKVDTPPSDSKFSDAVHIPELSENPDDQEILQFAMAREHTAMEQYTTLANECEEGAIKVLFTFLAEEETKHKLELEKIYYELVHPSNV